MYLIINSNYEICTYVYPLETHLWHSCSVMDGKNIGVISYLVVVISTFDFLTTLVHNDFEVVSLYWTLIRVLGK